MPRLQTHWLVAHALLNDWGSLLPPGSSGADELGGEGCRDMGPIVISLKASLPSPSFLGSCLSFPDVPSFGSIIMLVYPGLVHSGEVSKW